MKHCAPAWPIWHREERDRYELPDGSTARIGVAAGIYGGKACASSRHGARSASGKLRSLPRIRAEPENGMAGDGSVGSGAGFDGFRPPAVCADRAGAGFVVGAADGTSDA